MALDDLPDDVRVLDRDSWKSRYLRDYAIRIPDADTGPNTLPDHDASTLADGMMILMNNVVVIGRATKLRGQTGARLDRTGASEGVARPPATAATGRVTITASAGGTTILDGDELTEPNTKTRYTCSRTAFYASGDLVPVTSVDPGPAGNLAPGTRLRWTSPRDGCAKDCLVAEATDGSGIAGGREEATDAEYIEAIEARRQNPPAAGNDAEVRRIVRTIADITVEEVFTYPAIKSTGTTAVITTLRPALLGAERFTTTTQEGVIEGTLNSTLQADCGFFAATLIAQPTDIGVSVTWARGATGWADTSPWPSFIAGDQVRTTSVTSATVFDLTTGTDTTAPQVGQTIGFFEVDAPENGKVPRIGKWRRKRILTVVELTALRSWTITVDTSNGASDTTYTPGVGDLVSPWSEGLDDLTVPVLRAMATLGPGEMTAALVDPGLRQRRAPAASEKWPNAINNLMLLNPVFDSGLVGDASIALPETLPYATDVGVPAVSAKLLTLGDLAFYAKD